MISLQNISRIYQRKQTSENVVALNNVSLSLPEKGFVSILGASGSGKTTLLNIIGGLDKPTSGMMIVDEISTKDFKEKDWDAYRNEKIGFVLQNCYLLPHLNIHDNVAVKLQISNRKFDNIDELVDLALKEVDLLDKRKDKPKALSGGQKQRVAIARAVVGKPTVILADEPTGALDSKIGAQIMDLLKKLSKDHLVVIVTHNEEYANKYSDRIIKLKDGCILSDTAPITNNVISTDKKVGKVSIPIITSLKWAFKNLIVKKYSTLSIILASSLGLAGVGLILSISSGVRSAFTQTEANALSQYPVTINSYSKQSPDGDIGQYEKFTDEQYVFADMSGYATQEHYNYMSNEFLSYMDKMPESYYYVKYDTSYTNFNIYTKVNNSSYSKVSSTSSLFYKGVENEQFVENEYDCLKGKYPTNEHELALVVDKYNRVSGSYLNALGFDIDISHYNEKKFTFDEVIGKTYRFVNNDLYYAYDAEAGYYVARYSSYQTYYDSSDYELKIVGILREKKDSNNPIFRTGVIYTHEFEDKVINDANASQIVIDQKYYGLSKNVRTGEPFEDQTGSVTYTKEYQYEYALFYFGSFERITTLYYFTKNFESRTSIGAYFEKYVSDEEIDFGTLSYTDYLDKVTNQFDGALHMMTGVLYVFAAISVVVSAILNGILTYISIHQRTSEIGLLRSLGARRLDIGLMIETESLVTGLLGSMFSILLSIILVKPLNDLVTHAIYQYNFYLLSKTTFDLGGFRWWVAPIMIGLGLFTALVSAIIPAIIASRKDPAHAINE